MIIRNHADIDQHALPGLSHRTLAGPSSGARTMEVWQQTLSASGETPWHRHDCEEVIVVLQGSGCCDIDGRRVDFGPQTTLAVPPGRVHKLANTGDCDLHLIAVLSPAPVVVETPDGTPIALPWSEPA